MRLPWPFGRSAAAPADTEPGADADAGSSGAPSGTYGAAPGAPPTRAWASLPPIQRASGEPPLVAPARTFLEGVPGAQPLPPIVGPLGHDVTPLAPAGVVAAPVHAVQSLTSNASLIGRPVQRRTADAPVSPDPAAATPAALAPAATAAAATSAAEPASTSTAATAAAPVEEPVRRLSVVASDAAADVPSRSLTRADAWSPPAVAAERPLVHRTNVQASSARSTAAGAPAADPAADAGLRQTRSAAADAPTTATGAQAPVAPAERRPGLGAPLRTAPATAVQRAPGGPSSPPTSLPAGAMPPVRGLAGSQSLSGIVQRRGAGARASTADADEVTSSPIHRERPGSPHAPYVGGPVSASLPSLPVVSRSSAVSDHDHPADALETGAPADGAGSAASGFVPASLPPLARTGDGSGDRHAGHAPAIDAQRATTPAPTAQRRPIVGARPLRPSTSPAPPRDGGAEEPAPGASASTTRAGEPAASAMTSWTNPALASLPELQAFRPSQPGAPAGPAAGVPSAIDAGGAPAQPGVQASRRDPAPMTLARPAAAPAPAATTAPSPIAYASGAGQVPGIVAAPGGTTVVQMTPAQALATPVLAPTATAIVQRADSPAPAPAPAPSGRSDGELEELARALFPRFQRQLRMEYVYEREARGLPFDR